jgi:hypothetical protein
MRHPRTCDITPTPTCTCWHHVQAEMHRDCRTTVVWQRTRSRHIFTRSQLTVADTCQPCSHLVIRDQSRAAPACVPHCSQLCCIHLTQESGARITRGAGASAIAGVRGGRHECPHVITHNEAGSAGTCPTCWWWWLCSTTGCSCCRGWEAGRCVGHDTCDQSAAGLTGVPAFLTAAVTASTTC